MVLILFLLYRDNYVQVLGKVYKLEVVFRSEPDVSWVNGLCQDVDEMVSDCV